jgi:N6-adenosine-specific RNA methylase IME4
MIADSLELLIQQGRQFGTIYVDPPWRYRDTNTRGAAAKHYRTMSLAEIAALPVAQLAAPNSHCHLWTTTSFLPEAQPILEAWGFRHESEMVWIKTTKDGRPLLGMGHYWRIGTELLELGVKGECPFPPGVEIRS